MPEDKDAGSCGSSQSPVIAHVERSVSDAPVAHTPGPWQASIPRRDDAHMCRITTAWTKDGCYLQLAQTWDYDHSVSYVGLSRAECIANARLIAAAPEMYAALKGVIAAFEAGAFCRSTDGDHDPAWAIKFFPHLKALADATVAVEKAEGRTP